MMREVLGRRFKRLMAEAPRASATPMDAAANGDPPEVTELPTAAPLLECDVGARHASPLPSTLDEPGAANVSDALIDVGARHASPIPLTLDEQVEGGDDETESPWPDLVLIDGGRGQLSAAYEALTALGITDVPLVAIAKGPERDAGRETFFLPGREPIKLKPRDPVLYFVQRLRDEAHRFAVGSHRTRRRKDIRESGLQEIPGIGPTRKRALLQHFGTLKAIERASLSDLAHVEGISAETARKIYDFFHEGAP
jgi:excinuclease ABC subunit C